MFINSLRKIEYLSDILVQMSDGKRINFFKRIMLYLTLNVSFENLESQGIAMQISLEEKYLDNVIHIM